MRHTRSEWSRANSSYYNESDAGTIKSQLESISKELDDERKKTKNVISKQTEELEEYKRQREDGLTQHRKMVARMEELQGELEQTIKRIETLQRGGGGYGARANRPMNFGGSQGSRNSSKDSRNYSNGRQPFYRSPFDRDDSRGRSTSNTKSAGSGKRVATNTYRPPPMRTANPPTRVSPVRSSGYGPQQQPKNNRVSPNRVPVGKPSPSRYANVQSRLYQGTTASLDKRIPSKPEPRQASLPRDAPVRPTRSTERRASPAQQQSTVKPVEKMPPRVRPVKPVVKVEPSTNKENARNNSAAKRVVIPEEIDSQDIDAKLNRLQDLLKMAKSNM